jgi:deoxyribose-phosphate aldolase
MSDVDLSSAARLRRELARLLELDLREPALTRADLEVRCREANQYQSFAVSVCGSLVAHAATILEESPVQLVAAVGFPFGNMDSDVKRFEAEAAVDSGAQIIEVVANVGRIRERDGAYLTRELRDIVEAAEERPVGAALPAAVLNPPDLEWLLPTLADTGIRGVTLMLGGQGDERKTVELVQQATSLVGPGIGIKADIVSSSSAYVAELLQAGAVRFGVQELSKFLGLLENAPPVHDEKGR